MSPGASTMTRGPTVFVTNSRNRSLDGSLQGSEDRSNTRTTVPANAGTATGERADAARVQSAARHHWLNTLVGIIDAAFSLTDEELFFCQDIIRRLLEALQIPDRGEPEHLPATIAHEAESGAFAVQLYGSREVGLVRIPRLVRRGDTVVTLEAWRTALLGLIVTAYPQLNPLEELAACKVLDDLLIALGVPDRVATFVPEDVVRAHLAGA